MTSNLSKKPIFNNVENKKVRLDTGEDVFLSRSPALCVPVTARIGNERYTLISQRGEKTPNYQYHYNLVCGYLDYNENSSEGCRRELWEETGINYDAIPEKNIVYPINQKSWDVDSEPNTQTQNVTIRHGVFLVFDHVDDLPETSIDNCEEGEVIHSIWVKDSEALLIKPNLMNFDPKKDRVWAFNHYDVYRKWNELTMFL